MSVDAEGYGFPEHQQTLARLMDDIRVLSPAGVERVAHGWDDHVGNKGLQPSTKPRRRRPTRSSRRTEAPPGTRSGARSSAWPNRVTRWCPGRRSTVRSATRRREPRSRRARACRRQPDQQGAGRNPQTTAGRSSALAQVWI